MLVGPNKERPTFISLTPTQFMSGCLKAALDLPESEKNAKLEYLSGLLEDASDFDIKSAKACHAVVLSAMEQDKLTWFDTEKLDRHRRCHAQRHSVRPNDTPDASPAATNVANVSDAIICRFWNYDKCFKEDMHLSGGNYYKHKCSKCGGNHKAKNCRPGSKN